MRRRAFYSVVGFGGYSLLSILVEVVIITLYRMAQNETSFGRATYDIIYRSDKYSRRIYADVCFNTLDVSMCRFPMYAIWAIVLFHVVLLKRGRLIFLDPNKGFEDRRFLFCFYLGFFGG